MSNRDKPIVAGQFGVLTIRTETRHEAVYWWGYVHARDRAYQMDMARRSSAGRLAEWFGSPLVDADRLQRVLGLTRVAEQILLRLPSTQRQLLDSYTQGVNAGFARRRFTSLAHGSLRTRIEPWRETDTLLVLLGLYQSLAFDLAARRCELVLKAQLPASVVALLMSEIDPAYGPFDSAACPLEAILRLVENDRHEQQRSTGPLDPGVPGSNCWTIGGGHTRSGAPILACDLHLPPTVPNHWHRVELAVGSLRVHGVAIAGLPVVVAGSNGWLSWGVTNVPGDTLDLVPADDCGARTSREERIGVWRGEDLALRVEDTPAGPVLDRTSLTQQFVVVWSGLWPESTDLGLGEIAWATDPDQAIALARQAGAMPLNLHLAHRSGVTLQMVTGRIPKRVDGHLVPARFLDPHSLPVVRSGSEGWLVSANDRRRGDARDLPAGWNHAPGFRARRIQQLLADGGDWTEHRVFAMQHDVRSEILDFYRDLAIEALGRARDSGPPARAADIEAALTAWDGAIADDSVGAPLLMRFRSQLRARLLNPLLAPCIRAQPDFVFSWRSTESAVRTLVATRDARLLPGPPGADWFERVAAVLFAAASELARHGVRLSDLRWGQVTSRALVPPRARGGYRAMSRALPLDAAGDDDCVAVNTPTLTSTMRLVVSPGREGDAVLSMPGGQSESPQSRHFADQHRSWRAKVAGRLLP